MLRKTPLVPGEVYHLMNKSIAGFKIFNSDFDYLRMKQQIMYYNLAGPLPKFSRMMRLPEIQSQGLDQYLNDMYANHPQHLVQIVSFCLMPTHIHLLVKEITPNGASTFIGNVLNSYARFFNTKYHRLGPLWVGRFKNVLIENDEQMLHCTRYQHLNPVKDHLVQSPRDWVYSSYHEYIGQQLSGQRICNFEGLLDVDPKEYAASTEAEIGFHQAMAYAKWLTKVAATQPA